MSKAEDLFNRWYYLQELTNEEILELQQDIRDFFASDEPEEDKEKLAGYMGDSFIMLCCAIREGGLENRKPIKPTEPRKRMTFELEVPEFLKRKGKENTENKNQEV